MVAKTRGGTTDWLRSPLGGFAAALPGFIIGYFTLVDGPLSTAAGVYLWIGTLSAISYALVWLVLRPLPVAVGRGLPILAALAAALYYWFAAPAMAEALRAPAGLGYAIQAAAFGLVTVWNRAALRGDGQLR